MTGNEDSESFWDIVGNMDSHFSPIERAASDSDLVDAYLDWWHKCTSSPENSPSASQALKAKYAEVSMRYGLEERDFLTTMNLIAEHLNDQ